MTLAEKIAQDCTIIVNDYKQNKVYQDGLNNAKSFAVGDFNTEDEARYFLKRKLEYGTDADYGIGIKDNGKFHAFIFWKNR